MVRLLLMLAAQAAPMTRYEALTLPPAPVGERLLAGQEHRPIVAVEAEPLIGLKAPGVRTLWLYEAPQAVAGGCLRRQWVADFRYRALADRDRAVFEKAWADEEVAVPVNGSCQGAAFASYTGVTRDRALALLGAFDRWRERSRHTVLRCSSERRGSTLCADVARTPAALRRVIPWHVPADLTLWAKSDGHLGTTITFDTLLPKVVTITDRIPAPS